MIFKQTLFLSNYRDLLFEMIIKIKKNIKKYFSNTVQILLHDEDDTQIFKSLRRLFY